MQKSNNFIIYNLVLNYEKYIRKYVLNKIPNNHRDLRIHLMDENYNLVKYLYYAIYNKGNIRTKYITDLLISLSLLDYILSLIMTVTPENKKYIITSLEYLANIKNMVFTWKKRLDEESKSK